jgi:hypothetical protein
VINFRYHVVSLTAVFLALAIGLVVGTAALNGPVADSLKDQVEELNKSKGNLRDEVTQLQDQSRREQDFVNEAAPAMIGGKLTGRKLLVVVLPGGQEYADGVVAMLTVAGAKVTGRVTVQDKFLAPANNTELLDIAHGASQPTVPAAGLPLNSNGVETSSALLAIALLERTQTVTAGDLTAVLTAYTTPGYIAVDGDAVSGAEATVVVSGVPPVDKDGAAKSQNALTLTTQFAKDKPLVVAGSGIGDGNLISGVRGDPTLVKSISTVDNVNTAQGKLVTALVVAERVVQGKTGQYGLATGAGSMMPKLVS